MVNHKEVINQHWHSMISVSYTHLVLESVLSSVEETLSKDDSTEKLKRIEKEISSIEKNRKKLTDMYLDDKIPKEAYDDKYSEISNKLDKCEEEMYDGLYAVCTDLLDDDVADILKVSEGRWQIEDCFRTMKTDFERCV